MANKPTMHIIRDVQALYPKINQTYKFDKKAGDKGRTVSCPASDDGAKYEMSFKMTKPQAQALYAVMEAAYKEEASKSDWDEAFPKPAQVFKKDDKDDMFIGDTRLKGKYGNQFTEPPMQVDAKNKKLPPDFELTTGSKVNLSVVLVPYNMNSGHGVSLRLKAVQVLELAERKAYSPFDIEDEGFSVDDTDATGFEDIAASADIEPDEVSEEVAEPKKVKKKKAEAAPAEDPDLQGILEDWADDDAA
mgnify:FL=1